MVNIFFILDFYLHACVSVYMSLFTLSIATHRGQERASDFLEVELKGSCKLPVWVLGTEPRTSGRAWALVLSIFFYGLHKLNYSYIVEVFLQVLPL